MKGIIAGLIVIALLIGGVYMLISNSNDTEKNSPVQSTEAILSDRLRFPSGYHLAEAYSYAFAYTGPNVVYICQSDTDVTEYRICTPEVTTVDVE